MFDDAKITLFANASFVYKQEFALCIRDVTQDFPSKLSCTYMQKKHSRIILFLLCVRVGRDRIKSILKNKLKKFLQCKKKNNKIITSCRKINYI